MESNNAAAATLRRSSVVLAAGVSSCHAASNAAAAGLLFFLSVSTRLTVIRRSAEVLLTPPLASASSPVAVRVLSTARVSCMCLCPRPCCRLHVFNRLRRWPCCRVAATFLSDSTRPSRCYTAWRRPGVVLASGVSRRHVARDAAAVRLLYRSFSTRA